jgi:hypothetical protein
LEELPAPMVHVDMDMFVLADDVIIWYVKSWFYFKFCPS